jgi:putative transposase
MAESFMKTMKHDYVAFMPKPDAATAVPNLAIAFEHYNKKHPHSALKYRSPREFRRTMDSSTVVYGRVRDYRVNSRKLKFWAAKTLSSFAGRHHIEAQTAKHRHWPYWLRSTATTFAASAPYPTHCIALC